MFDPLHNDIIYLDFNATTPIDPEVEQAMRPYLEVYFGNPSGRYKYGIEARQAIETARYQTAALIGALPEEIVFTSGGSESNNHAIKGVAFANRHKGNHIIVSAIEHPAVLEVCKWLSKQGFKISQLPVDSYGRADVSRLQSLITPATILISVMHSNNETGTLQPIHALAKIAREHGVLFHSDAAQSVGKVPVNVSTGDIDLLSIAGHKLYAPKGVGALYIRKGVVLDNLIHGAGQEQNMRAGTENLLEVVGLGKACEIAARDLKRNSEVMRNTRDALLHELQIQLSDIHVNTYLSQSLPNTLSVAFKGITSDTLLSALPQLAVSAGAACHPGGAEASYVLTAMGASLDIALGTVRFSTGKHNTIEEIKLAVNLIAKVYSEISGTPSHIRNSDNSPVKLTQYTHGLGCACKMQPSDLEAVLRKLPPVTDSNVLVGNASGDDAAVYSIGNQKAVVQTLDFFTPIVDDPHDFGSIAAANALSDIYAMGAQPLFALNIVAFPVQRLPLTVLEQILKGAAEKAAEAGIDIIGGHSIDDPEPKFGMCVTGILDTKNIWKNTGAKPGDVLILTKPLGTGIISTALKSGLATQSNASVAINWMKMLNKNAADVFHQFSVHACTDITGFGLAGHLSEMTRGSGVNAEITFAEIPFMPDCKKLALAGAIPGGTMKNYNFYSEWLDWKASLSETEKLMFCDAQTSGGLLVAVPQDESDQLLQQLHNANIVAARMIGRIIEKGNGLIRIV